MKHRIISSRPSIVDIPPESLDQRLDAGHYRWDYLENRAKVQSLPWGTKKLGSLLKRPSYRGKAHADCSEGNVPNIKVRNLSNYGITGPYDFVDGSLLRESDRSWIRKGDVALAVTGVGSLGKVDLYFSDKPATVDGHIALLRCTDELDSGYLKAFLQSAAGQKLIEQDTVGSTGQTELYGAYIDAFDVPYPTTEVQAYIGDKVRLAEICRVQAVDRRRNAEKAIDLLYEGVPVETDQAESAFVCPVDIDASRLDAWHYLPRFTRLIAWLRSNGFVELGTLVTRSNERWRRFPGQRTLTYVQTSDADVTMNAISAQVLLAEEAPARAQRMIRKADILISTVRPNRKAVAVARPHMDGWVASTGFSILRAKSQDDAYFVAAVLRHDASTLQLLRWNTGATYPAIADDVPLRVLVPDPGQEERSRIGQQLRTHDLLVDRAIELVAEARSDVEALIESRLDVEGIVAGRVKAPTWEQIAREMEAELGRT